MCACTCVCIFVCVSKVRFTGKIPFPSKSYIVVKNDPWVFNFFLTKVHCSMWWWYKLYLTVLKHHPSFLAFNRDHHRQIHSFFLEFYAHHVSLSLFVYLCIFLHVCMHTFIACNEPSLFRHNNIVVDYRLMLLCVCVCIYIFPSNINPIDGCNHQT